MAKPRLPQKVAEITGAAARSPGRYRGRSSPAVKSLGPAPKRFTKAQTAIWDEFNDDLPWLGRSDRRVVGLAVMMQDTIDTDPACPIGVYAQMRMLLSAMGATPVDRSKVAVAEDEDDDPASEFVQ